MLVAGENSGSNGEETRKEQVDWKKIKLEAEIRDLLSRDRKMSAGRIEGSRQKACWEAKMHSWALADCSVNPLAD
jgi:hypothetical protein